MGTAESVAIVILTFVGLAIYTFGVFRWGYVRGFGRAMELVEKTLASPDTEEWLLQEVSRRLSAEPE